ATDHLRRGRVRRRAAEQLAGAPPAAPSLEAVEERAQLQRALGELTAAPPRPVRLRPALHPPAHRDAPVLRRPPRPGHETPPAPPPPRPRAPPRLPPRPPRRERPRPRRRARPPRRRPAALLARRRGRARAAAARAGPRRGRRSGAAGRPSGQADHAARPAPPG